MYFTCLSFLLITFRQFFVGSLQSVLVSYFIVLVCKTVSGRFALMEETNDEDIGELFEEDKSTRRIRELEQELERTANQLLEARNQLNTLISELTKYKRIHGQLSWAIVRQCENIAAAEAQPPPPPPPPPPLPPPLDTVSCNGSVASGDSIRLSTESDDWDADAPVPSLPEDVVPGSVDVEDDGWETTDEGEFGPEHMSTPDTESDLRTLLINVNTRTHISEIFRQWNNTTV
uniref:Uncharacterized protein n=1 Tax=Cuerna arida TaxID=1464854 RepID=A0A1B6G1J6_9HEMI